MTEEKRKIDIPQLIRKTRLTRAAALKILVPLCLVCVLAFLFPRGEALELENKTGAIWARKDLIAPFSFSILRDEKEYARDVEEAKNKVFDVFERDSAAGEQQVARLATFFNQLEEAIKIRGEIKRGPRTRVRLISADSTRFARIAGNLDVPFSEREWDALGNLAAKKQLGEMHQRLESAMRDFHRTGVLDRVKSSLRRSDIAIRRGTTEQIVSSGKLYDRSEIVALLEQHLQDGGNRDEDPAGLGYKIGVMFIGTNVKFNAPATEQALASAIDAVPRTNGFVQENERIISKHERINTETKLKLDSLRRAKTDRGSESDNPAQVLGTLLHIVILLLPFGIYLQLFRKRIIADIRRLALIASVMVFVGAVAYVTRELDVDAPLEYLIFVPSASMLLTILFDSRVGFYGTVTLALLVGGIRGNDYSVALSSLVAGALAVYSVRDMKNRTQIFRSLGFIFLGYALSIAAIGMERFEPLRSVGEQLLYGFANAVISPVLTYGLLVFLEKVFQVTTDLTLMELAHFNHPLLRLLAEKAPGTYHHSLTMATLAEAGAATVGANEVLARVAAYFHDIGKVVKPSYFVENQKGSRNRHDKLAPRMSSLIIAAHVKDGMALAREYHLPEEIVDFIPMHHGTTRIDYFYSKALKLAEESTDETKIDEINEQDYRYPGPKPQTKETGIMMLADTIEAAVRAIEEPTPQRLEGAISEFIKKRADEGELDECPLTMNDLTKIKAAFLGVLVGIHHTRVKYPVAEKKKPRSPKSVESVPEPTSDGRLNRTIKEIEKE